MEMLKKGESQVHWLTRCIAERERERERMQREWEGAREGEREIPVRGQGLISMVVRRRAVCTRLAHTHTHTNTQHTRLCMCRAQERERERA